MYIELAAVPLDTLPLKKGESRSSSVITSEKLKGDSYLPLKMLAKPMTCDR